MEFFVENISSVVFVPFWVFLLILIGKFTGVLKSKKITFLLTILASLYGLVSSFFAFINVNFKPNFVYESIIPFISIKGIQFPFGVYLDLLSALMLLVLFVITVLVQIYSYKYMNSDRGFIRFFAYINFFTFAMAGLILAPNIFQTYVFWELVGVASYLLIAFWYKKQSASDAGKKAFIMNRIGDFGLLIGLIYCSVTIVNYGNNPSFVAIPYSELNTISGLIYSYSSEFIFNFVCILLFLGSIAKSAQFPLHTWIEDAMEGPTPVSALIHSATMVAAGVYLVARTYPIYYNSEFALNFIAIIGLITAVICAFFAFTAVNIKKVLAFSTSSQLGLMFLALGAGSLTGSMLYLTSHAFVKAMLFLIAGILIHSINDKFDIKFMGGLRKDFRVLAVCWIIGILSLTGVAFGGAASKGVIFYQLIETQSYYLLTGFLIVSFMTAFYLFRLYFIVFEGNKNYTGTIVKSAPLYNFIIILFALIILFLGIILPHIHDVKFTFITFGTVLIAFVLAWYFYYKRASAPKIPILYQLSYNKLYIDNLYKFISDKIYCGMSGITTFIEKYIFDGAVCLVTFCIKLKSWLLAKLQTGNLQSYLCYSLFIIAMLFTMFVIAYSLLAYILEV